MSGLQRSQISFRRQGSSGMVWDDKFLNSLQDGVEREQQEQSISSSSSQQETASTKTKSEQKPNEAEGKSAVELRRSKSEQRSTAYRAVKVINDEDPPSPRVSSCGFCFGKKSASKQKGAAKSSAGSESDKKKIGRKV